MSNIEQPYPGMDMVLSSYFIIDLYLVVGSYPYNIQYSSSVMNLLHFHCRVSRVESMCFE